VHAVLFDLDGTLLDTLADISNAMNHVLSELGCPTHAPSAYRRFVGDGVPNLVRRALPPDRIDEETVRRAVAAMREEYSRRMFDETRPYEGVPEMLRDLGRRELPLTVLSNKPDGLTKECVERLLPGVPFETVRGARDGVPRKPDPAAALEIAQKIGMPPRAFLYLGDTNTDMRTATAAGMLPVGALWGFRDETELRESGAKEVIARPLELPELVDRLT
jgi:phosphoglycolate phosphatase